MIYFKNEYKIGLSLKSYDKLDRYNDRKFELPVSEIVYIILVYSCLSVEYLQHTG
jgi:hypothetical protein